MRDTVSDSPCSTPSTLRLVTAAGPPPQLKVPALSDKRGQRAGTAAVRAQVHGQAPEPSNVTGTPNRAAHADGVLEVAGKLALEGAVEPRVPLARGRQPARTDAHIQVLQRHIVAAQGEAGRRVQA